MNLLKWNKLRKLKNNLAEVNETIATMAGPVSSKMDAAFRTFWTVKEPGNNIKEATDSEAALVGRAFISALPSSHYYLLNSALRKRESLITELTSNFDYKTIKKTLNRL